MRVRLIVGLALVAFGGFAAEAAACSCVPYASDEQRLSEMDGAFVGMLVERREPSGSEYQALHVYRVEERYKGDFGDTVDVWTNRFGGGDCGLQHRPGDRVALHLYRNQRGWNGTSCSESTPERMRAAANPPPARAPDALAPKVVWPTPVVTRCAQRKARKVRRARKARRRS